AKLVVSAPDRDTTRRSTTAALEQLIVGGVITNAGFQRRLLDQEPVVQGRATSRFVDEMVDLSPSDGSSADRVRRAAESAALAWVSVRDRARPCGPWGSLASFRLTPRRPSRFVALADLDREVHEIVLDPRTVASVDAGSMVVDEHGRAIGVLRSVAQATGPVPVSVDPLRGSIAVAVEGETHTFSVLTRSEHWAPAAAVGHGHAGAIVAPFPAVVAEIAVAPGDDVAAGSVVVVIEAMKMLHSLTATGPGSVAAVRVGVGDQIETGEVLVTFGADSGPTIGEDDPTYPGDQT
ncbi:MAG: biotin/lipoyl-containing protein, partial [Acidimicrobiales bacterium]